MGQEQRVTRDRERAVRGCGFVGGGGGFIRYAQGGSVLMPGQRPAGASIIIQLPKKHPSSVRLNTSAVYVRASASMHV